ncbi:hypothetical protein BZG36_03426 [Bifiguratus adelaidae]|uniref:Pre-mRNA-splicing factor SYF2 n=1 Tax=Bifiguratus adelaidae TaxID=1938954 RepID=A0A261XYW4_9FUNG|nr:hypothetical protein BZG36_03426 [Bifiguratus adelaidae]
MPPKGKKATKATKATHQEAPTVETTTDQEKTMKTKPDSQVAETATAKGTSSLSDRMKRLEALKKRRQTEVEDGNRRDRNEEYQKSKENPREEARLERKRQQAQELLDKKLALDAGRDYERSLYWNWSAEKVERWKERQEEKESRAEVGFTDYNQLAHRKYERLTREMKPDIQTYNEMKKFIESGAAGSEALESWKAGVNALGIVDPSDKPPAEAIDRLVNDTKKQEETRLNRSRKRAERGDDDISWINEKNRIFNKKVARFYDKYTKEIRDNLERGTAL